MIAVPSFRHILISTNLSNVNNDLVADLQYARTEAVSRQVAIDVASSSGGWQSGWTVEIPSASTAAGAVATVLRSHVAIPSQYVLSGSASPVSFQPQGSSAAGACFTVSAPGNAANTQPRFLQVLPAGMLQQTTSSTTPTGCPAPAP
jgi:type IV fimbrial biogenesis protein FimT